MGSEWLNAITVDTAICTPTRAFIWLPLGSAWIAIAPSDDDKKCYVWLGGETENPMYTGGPAQICSFTRGGCKVIFSPPANGGPATSSNPACTSP
jgi:hypothetical protein